MEEGAWGEVYQLLRAIHFLYGSDLYHISSSL